MDLRLSCTTWTFEPLSVIESIPRLHDLGFEGVDFPVASQLDPYKTTASERALLREVVEGAELAIAGLHWAIPQGLSYNTPDPDNRRAAVEYFKRVIDMAEELGAHAITLGCGYTHRIPPEWNREDAIRRARDSWEQWARHLEGKRVQVGLEVLSRLDVNVLNTVDECLRFLAGLLGPNLGLTLDTYHMNIEEQNLSEAIRRAGQHLKVFQVAENNRNAPGTGHLPWKELFAALRAVDYRGFVSVEMPPMRWGESQPREASNELARGVKFLRGVMASV